jgi:glutamine---fructose-6-phosphate transaminase (isomerizing)
MCGIFGLIAVPEFKYQNNYIIATVDKLAKLSESRGKDSSGMAIRQAGEKCVHVIKGDIPIHDLIENKIFKDILQLSLEEYSKGHTLCLFGHSRLVTNGSQLYEVNNQPVIKDGIVIVHNGIIVNVEELWNNNSDIKREYAIDTEIIPAIIRKRMQSFDDLGLICTDTLKEIEGSYSIGALLKNNDSFILATNNGSLYYITDGYSFFLFASEYYYLRKLINSSCYKPFIHEAKIRQISANSGILLDLNTFQTEFYNNLKPSRTIIKRSKSSYKIRKYILNNGSDKKEVVIDPAVFMVRSDKERLLRMLEYNAASIMKLKRCNKCILPETFPFIVYDANGVCNYCNNYKVRSKNNSIDKLKELVEPFRRSNGVPECIVPFSGGRDSTYSLHIIKHELKLKPIAFTYDWGMVTDLARRNIARVCGKLGVENIIVSANIRWKRENIRKNIIAWLNNPELGMIPLFMAGDKYFFYYTNKLKKQTGISLNIWGINNLENTEFKTGFAGIPPNFTKERIYSLSFMQQFKLYNYIFRNLIKNPRYINQSVIDSLGSFASRYIAPKRDYFHLFDYYKWDEKEITNLIINEYKWETAIDTTSTWRIGDGTASFYNYIYYTVAGFSEVDTFRSNQIREGMLDRSKALDLSFEENRPRYETIRWYIDIIGLDFEHVIKTVNNIPKHYDV